MARLNRCGVKVLPRLGIACLALLSLAWLPGIGLAKDARAVADLGALPSAQVEVLDDGTPLATDGGTGSTPVLASTATGTPLAGAGASSALLEDDGGRLDPLSCGFVPRIVAEGAVQLPVDAWHEAQAIATAWLDAVGDPNLRLGEMRQLGDTYVLAIVDSSNHGTLRHQIVIGVHDGRVAVL